MHEVILAVTAISGPYRHGCSHESGLQQGSPRSLLDIPGADSGVVRWVRSNPLPEATELADYTLFKS